MRKLTITTIKGAEVEIASDRCARVVGNDKMRFSMISLADTADLGLHVVMGPVKAQVSASDHQAVRDFFARIERDEAEFRANYKLTDYQFSMAISEMMDRRDSVY